MPKNTKGKGGKNRRRGKHGGDLEGKAELVIKEEGQEYAQVRTKHERHHTYSNTITYYTIP